MLLVSRWWFPEPLPVLGPPDTSRIEARVADYRKTTGIPPSEDMLAHFADLELRDELLFRKALNRDWHLSDPAIQSRLVQNMRFLDPGTDLAQEAAVAKAVDLDMHLTDEVIRRRLVQLMERDLLRRAALPAIETSELRALYDERATSLVSPATVSFSHVFLGDVDKTAAKAALASLLSDKRSVSDARAIGKPFLGGNNFQRQTWQQVTNRFGDDFSVALAQQVTALAEHARWLQPIASAFGWHLVYVHGYLPETPMTFEQSADSLRWQLNQERQQAVLSEAIGALMSGYEVHTQ